ncbi:MAG: DUF305 domain-containing protein [Gordonia sp. (in: high G+C Gram-positive bacteria)]|uniref:DUF305 domain-containing protein n=1 Tax=Gordonia sp. (in: high G+C Gram-positive bacteria) TaxID=84139 RepID=UPI003C772EFE
MKTRLVASAIAAAAVVVGVAACSPNEQASDASTGSSTAHDMSAMASAGPSSTVVGTAAHNGADVMFAQMMLPHHEQALVMSDIVLGKSDIPAQVRDLAEQIKKAQGPEIAQLQAWLKQWNAPTSAHMDHEMDGMLSETELDELRAASGTDAAKLFLKQMIEHHEGAVDMAEEEIADGKNADAIEMARSIVDSQRKEIDQMKQMLTGL